MPLVNKVMSNGLNVHFSLNECIIKFCDDKVIVITPSKGNLYKMNFIKVHGADASNLVQSSAEDDTLTL